MTSYQPEWVRGRERGDHQRDCAARYEPIRALCETFARPFSVFDLGANLGYFSFRLASDFPDATVIAVDDKPHLAWLASENGLPNVVVLPRRLGAETLARLAQCEAFDLVLALNVLHHIADPPAALAALFDLGRRVVVETPGALDRNAAHPEWHDALLAGLDQPHRRPELLASNPSHVTPGAVRPMVAVDGWQAKSLTRQTLDMADEGYMLTRPADFRPGEFRQGPALHGARIETDEGGGTVIEIDRPKADTTERRAFLPGINLWNAVLLGCCWPPALPDMVARAVAGIEAAGRWHDDLRPWNFVLSGGAPQAIDMGWKAWRTEPEPGGLGVCTELMRLAHGTWRA